jgi:hypothetical protein
LDDPFADRQRDGAHGHTLPCPPVFVKLHVLWNCYKSNRAKDELGVR